MQGSLALANEAANEVVSGIRVVRSFNTEKREASHYESRLMDTHELKTWRSTVGAVYLLSQRVRSFFHCFLFFACMFLTDQGLLTVFCVCVYS